MGHRYVHPGFGIFGQGFAVLAPPPTSAQPGQSSLHRPSPGQHLKSVSSGTPRYLQAPARQRRHPANQLSGGYAVSPNQAQPGKPASQLADDQPGPSLLSLPKGLDISRVYGRGQQQSHSVYDDMPLSSEDLLAGIVAPRPPFSMVLTLWLPVMAAPSTSSGGFRVPALSLPNLGAQGLMEPLPGAVPGPVAEVFVRSLPRRKVVGQRPPRAAGAQQVQDGV